MNRKILNISLIAFVYTALITALCLFWRSFAEMYTRTVSSFLRFVLAQVTGIVPFSIGEVIVLLLVPFLLFCVCYAIISAVKYPGRLKGFFTGLLSALLLAVSVFVNVFGVCYLRAPLEDNMNLDRKTPTREDIYAATLYCKTRLEETAQNITYDVTGASDNPHSFSEMSKLVNNGYSKLSEKYDFISNINVKPKKIFLSPIMTYTHISGIYFPFTGEANVNTNYPDYVVAHTVGHEKAHQRGISGEDEAGFVSFLALSESGDDYLSYCALMTMYDHLLTSLAENDMEMYFYFIENTDEKIFGEMKAYHDFFEKYADSAASNVADSVNDTYIKVMGNSEGTKSYGKAVELYISWLYKNKYI